MDTNKYKLKVQALIRKSREKGLIKTYDEFLETEEAKEYALAEEEVKYYISKHNEKLKKYKIGDIVFVSEYKNGENGKKSQFCNNR